MIVVLPECEFLKAVLRGITDHRTRSFAHETARVIATSLNGEGALHLRAENHGGIHTDDGQQFSCTVIAAAQQFSHSLGELFQQRCIRGIVRTEFQAPSHGGESGESSGVGSVGSHGDRSRNRIIDRIGIGHGTVETAGVVFGLHGDLIITVYRQATVFDEALRTQRRQQVDAKRVNQTAYVAVATYSGKTTGILRCPHGETIRARHRRVLNDCTNLRTDKAAGLRVVLVADHHVLFEPVHRTIRDNRVVVANRNQGIQPERAGQQPVHQIAQPEERDDTQDLREYIGERSYDAGDCIVSGCALNISHETTGHTAYARYRNICYLAVRNLGVPVDTAGKCTRGEVGRIFFVQGEQTLKIEVKIYLSECQ